MTIKFDRFASLFPLYKCDFLSLFLNYFMVVSSSYNRIIAIHVCYVVVVSVWGFCFYFISSKSIALINGFIYVCVCVWIFTLSTFIAFLFSLLFSLKVVLFSCLCGWFCFSPYIYIHRHFQREIE